MSRVPILYSFRRCPYAMRARLALLVSKQKVELREVALRAKPETMLAASPKGTVPVLILTDGTIIDQSIDIMRWALAQNDPESWLEGDDAALIATNDGPFKYHLDRYKYPDRHGEDAMIHRHSGREMLEMLETRLSRNAYLCCPTRTLTDMALFPFVRQFAAVDPGWFAAQALPAVQHWLAGHLASDLFARAMVRVPPWHPDQAEGLSL